MPNEMREEERIWRLIIKGREGVRDQQRSRRAKSALGSLSLTTTPSSEATRAYIVEGRARPSKGDPKRIGGGGGSRQRNPPGAKTRTRVECTKNISRYGERDIAVRSW